MKRIIDDKKYIQKLMEKHSIPKGVAENISQLHEIENMMLEAYKKHNYCCGYVSSYLDNFYMELDDFVEFEEEE